MAKSCAVVDVRMDCFASRKSRSHWTSLLILAGMVVLLLHASGGVDMMGERFLAASLGWGPGEVFPSYTCGR